MSGSAPPQNPTSHHVQSLLPKFSSQDPDIRYMSLNDLHQILLAGHPTFLAHDYTTCARVVEGFLHTLNDQNGDVQNMAIRCLGPFVNKAPDSILCPMIEKISNLHTDNTIDSSVPALAVRAIVIALPRPVAGTQRGPKVVEAYGAVSKAVIPRLVGHVVIPLPNKGGPAPPRGMLQVEMETGQDTNCLDILTEVARCFGPMLQEAEITALQQINVDILESPRCSTAMKKKAVAALSILSTYFSDTLLSSFVSYTIETLRQPTLVLSQKKLFLSIYSAVARSIPRKFGPYLKTIAPFVTAPLAQTALDQQQEAEEEDDEPHDPQVEEVREAALVALDSFCAFCPSDMTTYSSDTVESALRFLKYDPNYAGDDEDMDDGDAEDLDLEIDEDFEEETGFDDEDDASWKVRRCSAKLLRTLVGARTLVNDQVLYSQIVPVLITRFNEREESVRLEVISTLASLLTRAKEPLYSSSIPSDTSNTKAQPASRKRRRGSSSAGFSEAQNYLATSNGYTSPATPPPQSGFQQSLAEASQDIHRACAKLLKSSTSQTKQASLSLLSTLVVARRGGLSSSLDSILPAVVEIMTTAPAPVGSSVAMNHSLRIDALRLLRFVVEYHSSKILQPFLGQIIPVVISAANDKYGKVAVEAIETIEVFIKALTPPRSAASQPTTAPLLHEIYTVIVGRSMASDADTEVRQKSVTALGLLIGRTSGSKGTMLLKQDDRLAGQSLILERLKNELTRSAAVRAIETIAILAQSSREHTAQWVRESSLELGAQLRKANRALRGASLNALKMLAVNSATRQSYDDETVRGLVELLLPLIGESDLHMLGPALVILNAYAHDNSDIVFVSRIVSAICRATKLELQGSTLDALLDIVETFGRTGHGKDLMQSLLKDVGVSGSAEVVGQVIGTLLVAAGDKGNIGVTLDDFKIELSSSPDEKRKCLALYILGEAGLRMGAKSSLKPKDFSDYFKADSEKVRVAAAVALGRAGAGDVKEYLAVILSSMKSGGKYLPLHSIKEMLQHSTAEADILEYTRDLWEMILSASMDEDNKALGAECVGRLAVVDPVAYLPQLQTYLSDKNPAIRGMVISAFRYAFTDTDDSYDQHLKTLIVPCLTTMLNEESLDNRRLALTTFNSAAHNKPLLVNPYLADLLPLTMKETVVKPELIREVAMGPFKHKVDDGLEIRKSAYETLYALMDTAFTALPLADFFDRIIAGIGDEHEIKIICCLMLTKLIALAPNETPRSLDKLADAFRAVLAFKPKDNAVKQELEKLQEHNKAIIRVMLQLTKAFPSEAADSRQWQETFEWAKREHPQAARLAEEELREKER